MRKPTKRFVSPFPTAYPRNLVREKSINTQKNWVEDTILYGEDDALPLRIAQAVDESPATTACINTISSFIKGSRFSDENLMRVKVDQYGTTLWELHNQLSDQMALFEGFCVNFKYNFDGFITNAYVLPFESVRFVKSDSRNINFFKYNPYFGTQEYKKDFTITYHAYNPKSIQNEQQSEGIAYNGQVYYYGVTRPLYKFYPVPRYWSAKDWIYVDGKIQNFHRNNLDNGFFSSVLMNIIGDPNQPSKNPKYQEIYTDDSGVKRTRSTKTVGEEFNEQMAEAFSGTNKAGTALVQWSLNADSSTKIQAFPTNANFDVLAGTLSDAVRGITMGTEVPAVLANLPQQQSSLGSDGNSIQKAIELMHSRVSTRQRKLEQFYNETLLPMMGVSGEVKIVNYTPVVQEVTVEDKFWEILPEQAKIQFIKENVPGFANIELTPPATLALAQDTQSDIKVNESLKNLTGRQLQGIQRIVRKYNKEELSFDQASQLLKSGFGFSDEEVNAWIVTPEE